MKGFNLAKFKKVKDTKDWATLVHADGHTINIAKAPLSAIQRKQLENLEMTQSYSDGTGNVQQEPNSSSMEDAAPEKSAPEPQATPVAQETAQADLTPSPDIVQSPAAVVADAPPAPASAISAVQSGAQVAETPFQAQIPGFKAEQAANAAEAQAKAQEGANEAKAYQEAQTALSNLPKQQDIIAANKQKSDDLLKAYAEKKIDPSKYWDDHSKVAAGIGLLLSAVGTGIGQGKVQNAGFQTLQGQINKEIERQKSDQSQAANLWKMNRQALDSDLAANLATQNQLMTGLKYKIGEAAAQSKGPIALANAQAANAKIDQTIGANNFKLALLNPTSDNPDPASRVQFLVPQERQQKVIDEINAAKNTVANAPGILEAFDLAAKDARPLTGGIGNTGRAIAGAIPYGPKTPGQSALQARLGPTFQDVEGTNRQSAMDNLDHNITPKFGDSDEIIATKRQSLLDYMKSKSSAAAAKSFGIDLSKFASTNTQAIGRPSAPQSALASNQASQYERKVINGKAYMVPVGANSTSMVARR